MCEVKSKPIKVKPMFYSAALESLQRIAREMGYNLLVHGSMDRDMDLLAVAWVDEPRTHLELLSAISKYLGAPQYDDIKYYGHSVLAGGRDSYVINLMRIDQCNGVDAEYYLDISFTPQTTTSHEK